MYFVLIIIWQNIQNSQTVINYFSFGFNKKEIYLKIDTNKININGDKFNLQHEQLTMT